MYIIYKFSFVAFLLLLSDSLYCQIDNDMVLWGSKQILWTDFKATPDVNNKTDAANISTKIKMEHTYITGDSIIIMVKNFFNTNKSWTRTDTSSWGIEHERRHFDLSEIYARKIRKALLEVVFKGSFINRDVQAIFSKIVKELNIEQDKYDNETDHSKNNQQQLLWDKKIKGELKQLELYVNIIVPLKVDWKR